jgi:hypothetical protein
LVDRHRAWGRIIYHEAALRKEYKSRGCPRCIRVSSGRCSTNRSNIMELLSRTVLGALSLSVAFAGSASAVEAFRKPTVSTTSGNGTSLLASRGSPVSIHADAADWPGVLRAAHDLAIDFGRVTSTNGTLTTSGSATANASMILNVTGISDDWSVGGNASASSTAGTIIVGTIGNSSLIDDMIASGQLDVSGIEGQWEAYVSTVVKGAGNMTGDTLVIAGTSS